MGLFNREKQKHKVIFIMPPRGETWPKSFVGNIKEELALLGEKTHRTFVVSPKEMDVCETEIEL